MSTAPFTPLCVSAPTKIFSALPAEKLPKYNTIQHFLV